MLLFKTSSSNDEKGMTLLFLKISESSLSLEFFLISQFVAIKAFDLLYYNIIY